MQLLQLPSHARLTKLLIVAQPHHVRPCARSLSDHHARDLRGAAQGRSLDPAMEQARSCSWLERHAPAPHRRTCCPGRALDLSCTPTSPGPASALVSYRASHAHRTFILCSPLRVAGVTRTSICGHPVQATISHTYPALVPHTVPSRGQLCTRLIQPCAADPVTHGALGRLGDLEHGEVQLPRGHSRTGANAARTLAASMRDSQALGKVRPRSYLRT